MTGTNPWLKSPDVDTTDDAPPQLAVAPATAIPAWRPRGVGVSPPAAGEGLSRRMVDASEADVRVWWVGAHGGAGESTLEQLLEGSRATDHAWPCGEFGTGLTPSVLLVARTNAHGLRAAQRCAMEWASGSVPVALHGLVLVADAPGKLPKPLKDFIHVVSGAVPRVWHLPWVEAWRVDDPVSGDSTPKAVIKILDELRALHPLPSTVSLP